jgi:hypothetical protein
VDSRAFSDFQNLPLCACKGVEQALKPYGDEHSGLMIMNAPPEYHVRAEPSFQLGMIPAVLQAKAFDHIFHSAQLFQ